MVKYSLYLNRRVFVMNSILLLFFQFYDAWKTLCDWLDSSSEMLAKFVNPSYASKQDIDDLKVSFSLYVYMNFIYT